MPPVFCHIESLWKQCLNLFVFQRRFTYIYTKQNFLYVCVAHPKLEVQCTNGNVSPLYFMFFFFFFTFTHLSCVTHSKLCASLCKLFPEVSMLLAWRDDLYLYFFLYFSFCLVIIFLFSFEKRLKCKISIKKKALQTAPLEDHITGDIVTSCDLLSSHTFFFADLFVM